MNRGGGYRRFCLLLLAALLVFVGINYLIWRLWTEKLLTEEYGGGDLARESYLVAFRSCRKDLVDLPRRHFVLDLRSSSRRKVDVVTLGDSFSFGIGGGRDAFYQDFLASESNLEVANVYPYPTEDQVVGFSPLTNLLLLYNSGVLDELRPKYVLIESVERYCILRYARPYDFTRTESREKLAQYYNRQKYHFGHLPQVSFINTGNAKLLYYNLLYRFADNGFQNRSYSAICSRLKRPMFSENGDRILFLEKDVQNLPLATDQAVALMNSNLNRMAELLEKKGIKLIFMPVVDKYDLYSEELVRDPYPRSQFFEKLRPLPKKYLFIDTKKLLREETDKGVKDLFYPDDSHWSWKASEKVFRSVRLPGGRPGPGSVLAERSARR